MELTNKQYTDGEEYRFGYQGQEKDNDIVEGAMAFKYRISDSRIGRFFSVDPLAPDYPHNSPYAFSENDVIGAIELEGLEKLTLARSRLRVKDHDIDVSETGETVKGNVYELFTSKGNSIVYEKPHDLRLNYCNNCHGRTFVGWGGIINSVNDVKTILNDNFHRINKPIGTSIGIVLNSDGFIVHSFEVISIKNGKPVVRHQWRNDELREKDSWSDFMDFLSTDGFGLSEPYYFNEKTGEEKSLDEYNGDSNLKLKKKFIGKIIFYHPNSPNSGDFTPDALRKSYKDKMKKLHKKYMEKIRKKGKGSPPSTSNNQIEYNN